MRRVLINKVRRTVVRENLIKPVGPYSQENNINLKTKYIATLHYFHDTNVGQIATCLIIFSTKINIAGRELMWSRNHEKGQEKGQ